MCMYPGICSSIMKKATRVKLSRQTYSWYVVFQRKTCGRIRPGEQQPYLDFVLELASPSTYAKDFNEKKAIYEQILRVKEYCIYDPYGEIDPSFIGFRLVADTYQEIAFVEGRLPCETLGLELGERDGVLRLYDPVKDMWFGPGREHAAEAETRAQNAEAELEKLRAALERLETTK